MGGSLFSFTRLCVYHLFANLNAGFWHKDIFTVSPLNSYSCYCKIWCVLSLFFAWPTIHPTGYSFVLRTFVLLSLPSAASRVWLSGVSLTSNNSWKALSSFMMFEFRTCAVSARQYVLHYSWWSLCPRRSFTPVPKTLYSCSLLTLEKCIYRRLLISHRFHAIHCLRLLLKPLNSHQRRLPSRFFCRSGLHLHWRSNCWWLREMRSRTFLY